MTDDAFFRATPGDVGASRANDRHHNGITNAGALVNKGRQARASVTKTDAHRRASNGHRRNLASVLEAVTLVDRSAADSLRAYIKQLRNEAAGYRAELRELRANGGTVDHVED